MAKKRPWLPPVPEKPAYLIDTDLHNEIDQLEAAGPKVVFVDGDEVDVPEKALDAAVNVLTLTRAALKALDEQAKALIEAAVPKEIADKLAAIDKEKKALKKKAEATEDLVKRGLLSALALGTLPHEGFTTKAGCKLTVAAKDAVEVTDPDALPDAFITRAPNIPAIKEALELDARRAAAAKELDLPAPEPTVYGAALTKSYYFTTKTPDVIEG